MNHIDSSIIYHIYWLYRHRFENASPKLFWRWIESFEDQHWSDLMIISGSTPSSTGQGEATPVGTRSCHLICCKSQLCTKCPIIDHLHVCTKCLMLSYSRLCGDKDEPNIWYITLVLASDTWNIVTAVNLVSDITHVLDFDNLRALHQTYNILIAFVRYCPEILSQI